MMILKRTKKQTNVILAFFQALFFLITFRRIKNEKPVNSRDISRRPDNSTHCIFFKCSVCLEICPNKALRRDGEEIILNGSHCLECELCKAKCPESVLCFESQK